MDRRRAATRLWLLAEGLPPRVVAGRPAVWGDASLHSDLRGLDRCARHGNSGRTSRTHDGQVEIRTVANDQSGLRLDDNQVYGFVSNETNLRFWLVWHAGVCRVDFKWTICGLSQDLSQG